MTSRRFQSTVGVSSVSLYNIINGKQEASANTLSTIAKSLDVPFWQLFVSPEEVTGEGELIALIQHKGDFCKASTIEELEKIVDEIKGKRCKICF